MSNGNPDTPAVHFLRERKLYTANSTVFPILLGCIGCRWLAAIEQGEAPTITRAQIKQCGRITQGSIFAGTEILVDLGIMDTHEVRVKGRAGKINVYTPTDSKLGDEFLKVLSTPEDCGLKQESQFNTSQT